MRHVIKVSIFLLCTFLLQHATKHNHSCHRIHFIKVAKLKFYKTVHNSSHFLYFYTRGRKSSKVYNDSLYAINRQPQTRRMSIFTDGFTLKERKLHVHGFQLHLGGRNTSIKRTYYKLARVNFHTL